MTMRKRCRRRKPPKHDCIQSIEIELRRLEKLHENA